jgi:HSP20 family protein
MRFVNVYPGSASRNHFFPTNVNRTEQAAATKCAPKTTAKNRPAVNIIETEDDFRIELAAPGFGKDDFHLNVENQVLTIAGKKEIAQKEGEKYTRREFNFNEFERRFTLSETIDLERINAAFNQGILVVTLAKKEESKPQPPRKIEIV